MPFRDAVQFLKTELVTTRLQFAASPEAARASSASPPAHGWSCPHRCSHHSSEWLIPPGANTNKTQKRIKSYCSDRTQTRSRRIPICTSPRYVSLSAGTPQREHIKHLLMMVFSFLIELRPKIRPAEFNKGSHRRPLRRLRQIDHRFARSAHRGYPSECSGKDRTHSDKPGDPSECYSPGHA